MHSVGGQMFSHCLGLISISMADSGEYIGSYAFDSCTNLISIEISENVKCFWEKPFGNSCEESQTRLREVICVKGSFIDSKRYFFEWNQYGMSCPSFSYKISGALILGCIFGEYGVTSHVAVGILGVLVTSGIILIILKNSSKESDE